MSICAPGDGRVKGTQDKGSIEAEKRTTEGREEDQAERKSTSALKSSKKKKKKPQQGKCRVAVLGRRNYTKHLHRFLSYCLACLHAVPERCAGVSEVKMCFA